MLIALSGLPGSGKTTLAQSLSQRLGAQHLRIDTIEEVMLAENGEAFVDSGAGYRVAYALAADNLQLGGTVVADAVNPISVTREAWRNVAKNLGVPFVDVLLICSDSVEHRNRVEARSPGTRGSDWTEIQDRLFETADDQTVVIDTSNQTVEQSVNALEIALRARAH